MRRSVCEILWAGCPMKAIFRVDALVISAAALLGIQVSRDYVTGSLSPCYVPRCSPISLSTQPMKSSNKNLAVAR